MYSYRISVYMNFGRELIHGRILVKFKKLLIRKPRNKRFICYAKDIRICRSIYLSIYLYIYISIPYPSIYLSIYLSLYLYIYPLSIYLFICCSGWEGGRGGAPLQQTLPGQLRMGQVPDCGCSRILTAFPIVFM